MSGTPGPAVPDLFAGVGVATTTRADGDIAVDNRTVAQNDRRRAVVARPWVGLRQVHGADVHVVGDGPVTEVVGRQGDALVSLRADVALVVRTADCAPVAFAADNGAVGIAHAGWKGLAAGVVGATVDALRHLGASVVAARLGPCIGPCCYEFGAGDLDRLRARFGPSIVGATRAGHPALDLRAAVAAACAEAGVALGDPAVPCTGCDADRWFSHRARAEPERMATVVWRDGPA